MSNFNSHSSWLIQDYTTNDYFAITIGNLSYLLKYKKKMPLLGPPSTSPPEGGGVLVWKRVWEITFFGLK